MKAKSFKVDSPTEIKSKLSDLITSGFNPTLAFVFIASSQDRKEVRKTLSDRNIEIFGATTSGEFTGGNAGKGSIVLLLLEMNRNYFKTICIPNESNSIFESAKKSGEFGNRAFKKPVFIIGCGGYIADGDQAIKGIEEVVGTQVQIFGGLAGKDSLEPQTIVFNNEIESNSGILALIIDQDEVEVNGFATAGWMPVGTVKTITSSEGQIVKTMDGEPALDTMMKYMGLTYNSEVKDDWVMARHVHNGFPIQLQREDAHPVLRDLFGVNQVTRALKFGGPVPEGTKFRFSLPPDWDEILEKIKDDCETAKNKLQYSPDAVVVFSCVSRLQSLGPMVNDEIEVIKNTWGSPLAGFFCHGEIGGSKIGQNEYYNDTCSVVLIKEKV
jgi:hypothetical protein